MSLINYLLSGYGPESEIFIENHVPKFKFINYKDKNMKYFQLNNIITFFSKSEYTKNNKQIYDITKNKLPKIANNIVVENNTSKTIVYFKYSHYIKYNEIFDNLVETSRIFDLSNSNVSCNDIINFISETFNTDIKKSFKYENCDCDPWLKLNQRLAGFYYYSYNNILHIYPNFA